MDLLDQAELENIGHLGIIAAIFRRNKLVQKIDSLLPKKSGKPKITHGEAALAMILQGLGFSSNRLYLSKHFFSNIAIRRLFRDGVRPEDFNSHALGRTLDAIYDYGSAKFFIDSTLSTLFANNQIMKFFHIGVFCKTPNSASSSDCNLLILSDRIKSTN